MLSVASAVASLLAAALDCATAGVVLEVEIALELEAGSGTIDLSYPGD